MAVLAPPFILCPCSESKDLLGFSKDRLENKVILTLGEKLAIRYSIPEQKQETSWISRVHLFSSKVVFCPDLGQYAAVIDGNAVCLWNEDDTSLVSMKKHKFATNSVHEVVPTSTLGTLIVFKNGAVTTLAEATQQRKYVVKNGLFGDKEAILDIHVNENTNEVFIISGQKGTAKPRSKSGVEKQNLLNVYVVRINVGTGGEELPSLVSKRTISVEDGRDIIGWCIIAKSDTDSSLLYLRSDGSLFQEDKLSKEKQTKKDVENIEIAKFVNFVSTSNPVVLRPCTDSTIIVYGCDPSEEGAIVFIYDLKYNLVISKQALKLYSLPPIMAKVEHNAFIPLGLNILVLGVKYSKSLLSSVVGQHQIQGLEIYESRDPWKLGWEQETKVEPVQKNVAAGDANESGLGIDWEDLEVTIASLETNGHAEASICSKLIPLVLEKCSSWLYDALSRILDYFEDIPEYLLVSILLTVVSDKSFVYSSEATTIRNVHDDDDSIKSTADVPGSVSVVNRILKRNFDRNEMVKSLREMDYDLAKVLLKFITFSIKDAPLLTLNGDELTNESTEYSCNLMKWAGAILDAHYTHFVFNNETVIVDNVSKVLDDKMTIMKDIENIEPLVKIITTKTKYDPLPTNSTYRVLNVQFR